MRFVYSSLLLPDCRAICPFTELQTGPFILSGFHQVKSLTGDIELPANFLDLNGNGFPNRFRQLLVVRPKGKSFRNRFLVNELLEPTGKAPEIGCGGGRRRSWITVPLRFFSRLLMFQKGGPLGSNR